MSQIEGSTALDDTYGADPLTAGANDDLDKDAFLKLLITQFQYQDPLNPMDDKEFIAQLAQFSALEQSMAINKKMDGVINSTDMQTVMSITNYIGKEVSARGLEVSKREGVISKIQYAAADPMADVYVNMIDAGGQVVSTIQLGSRSTSIHEFTWDGKTSRGTDAPDGVYRAAFAAKSDKGEPIFVDTSITGRVTGTSFYQGVHYLRVDGGRNINVVDVRETMEFVPPKEEEVVPGITVTGTRDNDYLVGGEGADTIEARAGNDLIVYDPIDVLVDGGDGYDFLIAEGEIGENAKNYEAIIRGASAKDIKLLSDLEALGLSFLPDESEIDITTTGWLANWDDSGKGQWTYAGTDPNIKMTITIMSKVDDVEPDPPAATKSAARTLENSAPENVARAATPSRQISFSEALQKGMNKTADNTIDNTAKSLSNNASNKISKFMEAMNG